MASLLEVKGGQTAGNDYISKVFRSKYHSIQQKYYNLIILDTTQQSKASETLASLISYKIIYSEYSDWMVNNLIIKAI